MKNAGGESSGIVGKFLGEYGVKEQFSWGYDAARGEYMDIVRRLAVFSSAAEE